MSVAMDAAYFELYFQPFVDRLQHTAPDIGLHLCAVDFILNPDLLPAKVGLSRMRVPRSVRGTKPARRAFFASARYLSLSDCLKHYEQIHVTDIDGIITPEIHNQLSAPVTLHSKLLTARAARLPFERVSAAGVSVRNDADGHRFASYMRSYLQHGFESSREGQWYIDQNALFSAWHSLKDSITFETDRPAFFKQAANWNLAGGAQAKIDFQTGSAL